MNNATSHLAIIKVNDEYGTPLSLFSDKDHTPKEVRKFFRKIRFDYFASDTNHVVQDYFTKKDDAFTKEWKKRGFCNFPYSQIYKCMKKAWEEHQKYGTEFLILCYSKTDTAFWHEFVEGKCEYYFHKGRIKFLDKDGQILVDKKGREQSSPYPSVWIIIRKKQ
tara:strand:+ start:343 stop:834 length:492 start_codon:yes stop_codon:yes gene_type:complete